jgi:hypothetical protein
LAALLSLAACASEKKAVVSDVQKIDGKPYYALEAVDEGDRLKKEEEAKRALEEEARDLERRVKQHQESTAEAAKPIYGRMDGQVQRVELKKTVVKPVVETGTDPPIIGRRELEELIKNIETEKALQDGVDYADPNVRVLIENYKNILKASSTCCPSVSIERMKAIGVPRRQLLRFLAVDSREYAVQNMCMIVSDKDIKDVFSNKNVISVLGRTRRDCICNNAGFLRRNISNFYNIYEIDPDFYDNALIYRFRDAEGRIIKQDILEAVINISGTLITCPS